MKRALVAEGVGTALLLMAVVGSGIMGEQLADGNAALALLANAISTGAMLYGLITVFGPISGGHFNPAVTLCFWLRGEITARCALLYGLAQVVGVFWGYGSPTGCLAWWCCSNPPQPALVGGNGCLKHWPLQACCW